MRTMLSWRPSPALVISLIALFVAVGGTSYAAITVTGKNIKDGSIRRADIGAKQVSGVKLASNAVTSAKVKDGSLLSSDFKAGQSLAGPTGAKGDAGPTGAKGDTGTSGSKGDTGAKGAAGIPGPTASGFASKGAGGTSLTEAFQVMVSLAAGPAKQSGPIRVDVASALVVDAAVEMHHTGGTSALPTSVECYANAIKVGSGQNITLAGPLAMEVFGQSNHSAFVTQAIAGANIVPPGQWDVRISCRNRFPPESTFARVDAAELTVVAVAREATA